MSAFIQEWKQQINGYSSNIRLFLLFSFVWNTGLGIYQLMFNLYVKSLGYDQTVVGNLIGAAALASAIVLIPAGIANDKLGPKRMISAGVLLALIALTARALTETPGGLLVSSFAGGMALAIVSVTSLPYLSEHSTPEQRVHLFSLNLALVMFANVAGNLSGGLLSDLFHHLLGFTEAVSLRITLLIGIGVAALGLIPVLRFGGAEASSEDAPQTNRISLPFTQLWGKHRSSLRIIGLFAMLGLLSSSAGGMVVPYLNVYFEDRFDAPHSLIGLVVSLGQGATAAAYLIGPVFARRLGEAKSVIVLQLSSIPFLLLTAYTMNFPLACGGYLFRQALMNAATPFYNSIKMNRVHRSLRGLAASSGEAAFHLGWFLAAPVSTGLVARFGPYHGYAYAFTVTAVVYTLVSILFYVFFGRKQPDEENREAEAVRQT